MCIELKYLKYLNVYGVIYEFVSQIRLVFIIEFGYKNIYIGSWSGVLGVLCQIQMYPLCYTSAVILNSIHPDLFLKSRELINAIVNMSTLLSLLLLAMNSRANISKMLLVDIRATFSYQQDVVGGHQINSQPSAICCWWTSEQLSQLSARCCWWTSELL